MIVVSADWDEIVVTQALSVLVFDKRADMVRKKYRESRYIGAYAFELTLVQAVLSRYRGL